VKALARSADFEGLTKVIQGLTDEPRNMQVEHIKLEFDSPQIPLPEKVNIVRSLIHTVSLIEEPSLRLQKLKDVLDNKTKYKVEFASLQSVDFGKFITFADVDTIDKILVAPFAEAAIRNQILSAFVSKQNEIKDTLVLKKFIQIIAEGISKNDSESTPYLSFIKKIDDKIFVDADAIQTSLIETYKKASDPLKQQIFDLLLESKIKLSDPIRQELEGIVLSAIGEGSVAESLTMLGNIPVKINKTNFDVSKITSIVNKRITTSTDAEIAQFANIMLHQSVRDEVGLNNVELTIATILELLDSKDIPTRSLIIGRLPEFMTYSNNKSGFIKRVLKSIEAGPITESTQILNTLQPLVAFQKN
jgi:hypothetical protein